MKRLGHSSLISFLFLFSTLIISQNVQAERFVRIKGKAFPTLPAAKSIEPIVKLLAPLSGTTLDGTASAFYNPATEEILVAGAFTALKELSLKRKTLAIFVNGDPIPAIVKLKKKVIVFQGENYRSGTFVKALQVPRDMRWPMRSISVEIANLGNNKVLARDRLSFYDMRDSGGADAHAPLNTEIFGMVTQLTDSGIGNVNDPNQLSGMEIAYLSSLPQPDLANFNTDFTANVNAIPTQSSNGLEACIPYEDLTENNFSQATQFGPYFDALAWAVGDHIAYEAADDACDALPNPAAILACKVAAFAGFCVHNNPQADDFELCVNRIDGDVEEANMTTATDASLKFLPATSGFRAKVESDVELGPISARVHGKMRNLFVRWKNSACVYRPNFNLNDSVIPTKPWLDTWTSCPNLRINLAGASSFITGGLPSRFDIEVNPTDPESLRATVNQSGNLEPILPISDPNHENCGLSFITLDVAGMLDGLVDNVMTKLNSTWFSGPVSAPEARALTKLLAPYRLGKYDLPGHDIETKVVSIGSDTNVGMSVFWETDVISPLATVLANQKQNFFFQPAGIFGFSNNAEDHHGQHFDISYTITTGLLNRILNTRGASSNLHFQFKPTWEELSVFGVQTPAGASPTDNAVLNKSTMKQFHSAFKGLGNSQVEIFVEPMFDPFVYMPVDPTAGITIPGVGSPMAYGLENLSVVFKTKDTKVNGVKVKGQVVMRAHVTFLARDFSLNINNAINDVYLNPNLDQANWEGNVVSNKLNGCAMYAHYPGVGQNCERSLEDKIASLIRNHIEQSIENFVSRVPSPKLFNVLGDATDPVEFQNQSKRQEGQNITYFGQVRRP